jgi:site-specific DNA-methyltransferase (adenine-specific)
MRKMEPNSIDFICTDPPYGLNFMGKYWDSAVPNQDIWAEVLRVCKPGSMLAAFGGSRTHHHLMVALERAGWEIRDCIFWLTGQGFPKSHNFGRKIGGIWEGYGTALKPAYEPIIIAMKPLDGTFAQSAEKWGVAGINVDESRIGTIVETWPSTRSYCRSEPGAPSKGIQSCGKSPAGRWPANVILDEEAADQLGSPSRFFYCAKASSSERNKGLDGLPKKFMKTMNDGIGMRQHNENEPNSYKQNHHPTVKPIALMKYILKLLAPPGNPTCLDPFAGSGSTLVAAQELGIKCIGIEKQEEYCEIARNRLKGR